jgi:hypothetical protein
VKEMLAVPFRVFGIAARPRSLPPEVVLLWNRLPVQSIWPIKVSPLLLLRSRFAVSTLPRLCGFPLADCRRLPFKLPTASSRRAAPSYRVLPSNTYPTVATAESSHGLLLPSAHQESEVHFREPSQLATFRLQGLVALLTVSSLEFRASFVSHRQRSWDSPFGGILSREVFETFQPERTHLPLTRRLFRRRSVRSVRRASVTGFAPPGIALRPHGVLSRGPQAPPLGFAPCRVFTRRPWSDFTDTPLACLAVSVDFSAIRLTPQSFNRPSQSLRPANTGV